MGARAKIGRVYFVAGRQLAIALELEGELKLVHWHEGVLCVTPVYGKLKAPAETPMVEDLLAEWGIESPDLDAFMEAAFYATHEECMTVRASRRAMGTGLSHRIGPGEARGRVSEF